MASNRLLILPDLHAGDSADGVQGVPRAAQDGASFWRVFSNWSARLSEACKVGVLYKADYFALLGDNIENLSTDALAVWAAVLNQIEAEYCVPRGKSNNIIPVFGNHEYDTTDMEVSDWFGTLKTEVVVNFDATPGQAWPGGTKANTVTSCLWTDWDNFDFLTLWGAGGLEAIWDNVGETYEEGVDPNAAAQLDWLENTVVPALTKPLLVFCHQHLSDSDGLATIPAAILSGTPDNSNTPLQTILSDCGQKVTCFCGHYHRVVPDDNKIWEKDTINLTANGGAAVDYYNLRGSVLGTHAGDMRGNTFFIVDIDTVAGVTNIMPFRYSNTLRDRYNPHDLDNVMGTHDRLRSRYS